MGPAQFAAEVAPEVDRCRLGVTQRLGAALAPLAAEYGVDGPAAYVFGMLRSLLPCRVAATADVRRVFTYEEGLYDAVVPHLVERGLVAADSATVALTPAGRGGMERLHEGSAGVADLLWGDRSEDVETCVTLLGHVLDATPPRQGAYAVLAPVYAPDGASPCGVLAEQLSAVRFHRFDAHVDAWAARGLTVRSVRELGEDDPRRAEVESDTNTRNGELWAPLDPEDRMRLLDVLRSLPGADAPS